MRSKRVYERRLNFPSDATLNRRLYCEHRKARGGWLCGVLYSTTTSKVVHVQAPRFERPGRFSFVRMAGVRHEVQVCCLSRPSACTGELCPLMLLAQQPSSPAAQQPSSPAAQQPSSPAAQQPSGSAAQRLSGSAASDHHAGSFRPGPAWHCAPWSRRRSRQQPDSGRPTQPAPA